LLDNIFFQDDRTFGFSGKENKINSLAVRNFFLAHTLRRVENLFGPVLRRVCCCLKDACTSREMVLSGLAAWAKRAYVEKRRQKTRFFSQE
jgi:hypothetical protein